MATPHALGDIRFDQGVAADLAAAFRSTASVLESQYLERGRLAAEAKLQWRGRYQDQYGQRLDVCLGNGRMFVEKLRQAGRMLDNAADDVAAEQARRERAQEEDRSWGEKLWDAITPGD